MRRSETHSDSSPQRNDFLPRGIGLLVFLSVLLIVSGSRASGARIVIVKASEAEPYAQAEAAIRARLADHHDDLRSLLLKEAAEKGVGPSIGQADVVVAVGTPAARWLQKQLPANIKLVYCMVTNPDEAGLLAGRESWGVTLEVALDAQLQVIAQTLPRARTVGMLYRADTPDGKHVVDLMKSSLPPTWRVEAVAVGDYPSIAVAIDALTRKNTDIIWTTTDQKLYDTAAVRALLLAGLRTKTPVWGYSPAFVRAGALVGVGVESRSQGNQAADLVRRALDGRCNAADKAQAPSEFQIAVNLIVAKQIGLDIPDEVSRRAAFVYRAEK